MQAIDLHVHSNRSDGTLSPTQLVDYAMEKGLSAFALTDHDTIDGLDEAMSYAASLKSAAAGPSAFSDIRPAGTDPVPRGLEDTQAYDRLQNRNVPEVIPGIEFSTEYQGRDIHVLGLDLDWRRKEFDDSLCAFKEARRERNREMADKLRQLENIDISLEKLEERFPGAVMTRAHFARFLLEKGYVREMREAFDRYVGDDCPCFVPRHKITPTAAIDLIQSAGGIPVLAHPLLYHMTEEQLETLVKGLKNHGLRGLEAIYSSNRGADETNMRRLARKYGLKISGGSDFHGAIKPHIDLGCGRGNLKIPYEVLKNLRSQ